MARLPTTDAEGRPSHHPAFGLFTPATRVGLVDAFDLIWRALYGIDWPRRNSPFGELLGPSERAAHLQAIAATLEGLPMIVRDRGKGGRGVCRPETVSDLLATFRRLHASGGTRFGRPVFEWETLAESAEYRELFERDVRIYTAVRDALFEGSLVVTLYDDETKAERLIPQDHWAATGIVIPCERVTMGEGASTITGRAWLRRHDVAALIAKLQQRSASKRKQASSKAAVDEFTTAYIATEKAAEREPTMAGLWRAAKAADKPFTRAALHKAFKAAGGVVRRGAPRIRRK